jgi:anti-sigma factor RsiW
MKWTLGSLGAAVAVIGGGLAVALPAQASNSTAPTSVTQTGVEDGTNDGETADDPAGAEIEDGTNDGETAGQ